MLDYDSEAAVYDTTRGGVPRAEAAASAVLALVPAEARTLLDIGCGTGLVTQRLVRPGLRVLGADGSLGMARKAAERTGRVVLGDVRRLPLPAAAVDAVSAVWLLHLVRDAAAVVAEATRVLRCAGSCPSVAGSRRWRTSPAGGSRSPPICCVRGTRRSRRWPGRSATAARSR
jgi:ubiquinone/menaquinone biosynthesis C-methylase UbiE